MVPFFCPNILIIRLQNLTLEENGLKNWKALSLDQENTAPKRLICLQWANTLFLIYKIQKLEVLGTRFVKRSPIDAKVIIVRFSSWSRQLHFAKLIRLLHKSKIL